jgi:uncharacterized protein (DUF1684 family)
MVGGDMDDLLEFRRDKDRFFKERRESPIPDRPHFEGLRYFPPNPDLVFTVTPEPADNTRIVVGTSDGDIRLYRRELLAHMTIEGRPVTLTLYTTPGHGHGYFLPFRDATSGRESYGAGRYLDLEANDDGTVTIDFNYAYNPSCAYDDAYSCPLPPQENWLDVPVRAGEQAYPH